MARTLSDLAARQRLAQAERSGPQVLSRKAEAEAWRLAEHFGIQTPEQEEYDAFEHRLFKGLSLQGIDALRKFAEKRQYRQNDLITEHETHGEYPLFLTSRGPVQFRIMDLDGETVVTDRIQLQEIGLQSWFSGPDSLCTPPSAQVYAAQDCEIYAIPPLHKLYNPESPDSENVLSYADVQRLSENCALYFSDILKEANKRAQNASIDHVTPHVTGARQAIINLLMAMPGVEEHRISDWSPFSIERIRDKSNKGTSRAEKLLKDQARFRDGFIARDPNATQHFLDLDQEIHGIKAAAKRQAGRLVTIISGYGAFLDYNKLVAAIQKTRDPLPWMTAQGLAGATLPKNLQDPRQLPIVARVGFDRTGEESEILGGDRQTAFSTSATITAFESYGLQIKHADEGVDNAHFNAPAVYLALPGNDCDGHPLRSQAWTVPYPGEKDRVKDMIMYRLIMKLFAEKTREAAKRTVSSQRK